MTLTAYVLIGSPRTRKSTLLRCLTGCYSRNLRDIELASGQTVRLYARVSALQDTRTTPQDFIAEVQRQRCTHAAFILSPQGSPLDPQGLPDAQAYLDAFGRAGWRIERVAVLGADPVKPQVPARGAVARFPNVLHQPVNASAALLRQHFGWR
ncbi:hypothetical protein KAK06_04740 [Ideonella sp. 4Y11]|uniref:Uncharacterized protein n=1 Tax=Ideonella aquatica TaxID=2824119 RepID=A0A940YRV4_9BURK|nr:hypothetical protein [Ideonella aquatica]MBQ0958255.1 hypothetical protein [Ideonella aquatica]